MKRSLIYLSLGLLLLTSCATRVVTSAPAPTTKVVIVKKAPVNHRVVVVKGKKYYKWNGKHYRKTNRGYVLVKH